MPKIQIELPIQVYEKLKKYAKEDDRSLNKYVTRGLIYLSDHPYHVPLNSATNTATATTIDLNALSDNIKIQKSPNNKQRTLTPQEEVLKEQKINLELDRIRKRRIKTIKEKMMNILGKLEPYIDETSPNYNESTIDFVLKKYPTDEDIDKYILGVKEEIDSYTEPEEELYEYQDYIEELEKKIKKTKEYEQIKDYCIHNDLTYELYQLLHYPSDVQCHNYDFVIKPALGTPPSYEYTQEELELLASYFTPQEETGG